MYDCVAGPLLKHVQHQAHRACGTPCTPWQPGAPWNADALSKQATLATVCPVATHAYRAWWKFPVSCTRMHYEEAWALAGYEQR